ncbi:MAG TPA: hypothetical protein VL361_10605 [Candidatus Limnocylindrales bacterium]|nr:hypothetical protein [Candidatus Limnocylindrales bacterium]
MRIVSGREVALGPGKADLLAWIAKTSSIREAADHMGMSYMRAWTLVQTMNACFRQPLVNACRGGKNHGGAVLTDTGRAVLDLYRELEAQSLRACAQTWPKLHKMLKD